MAEMENIKKSFVILLVEDNPGDVRLTQEAFKESKFLHEIYVARNGEEAIDFLYHKGKFNGVPSPDLILLDLNLPKKNGREVLTEIKSNPEIKHIPVVVLTTSEAEEDIIKSYELHANSYITKPVEFEQFLRKVKMIEDYWLSIVKLPGSMANV